MTSRQTFIEYNLDHLREATLDGQIDSGTRHQIHAEADRLEPLGFALGLALETFLERLGGMDFAGPSDGNLKDLTRDDLLEALLDIMDLTPGAKGIIKQAAREEVQ